MSTTAIEQVYFFGIGAIGLKYASMLQDYDPALVKVLADKQRIERYQSEGIYVNDKKYSFTYIDTATQSPAAADLLILGVKSQQLEEALRAIAPFVGPQTIILSLLNGVSTYDSIREQLQQGHPLYSIVYMDAVKSGNRALFKHPGKFVFGERFNGKHSSAVQQVVELFERVGVAYEVPEDMLLGLWRKYMVNIVVNQLSYILNSSYHIFQGNASMQGLMQDIGQEVVEVAQAQGIPLDQSDIDRMKATLLRIDGAAKTSMLQDRENLRPSEVSIFAAEMIRLGQRFHIPTPYNKFMYQLIKTIEEEEVHG